MQDLGVVPPPHMTGLFWMMSSVCLDLELGSDIILQDLLVPVDGTNSSKSFCSTPSLVPPDIRIPIEKISEYLNKGSLIFSMLIFCAIA